MCDRDCASKLSNQTTLHLRDEVIVGLEGAAEKRGHGFGRRGDMCVERGG